MEDLDQPDLYRAMRVLSQVSLHDLAVDEFGVRLVDRPQIFSDRNESLRCHCVQHTKMPDRISAIRPSRVSC